MITNHQKRATTARKMRNAVGLLALGAGACLSPTLRAADPYDKSLEARVEALERELNTMSNDSKGKNVTSTDVPTFIRASKNVQELTFSGELRFRQEYGEAGNQINNTNQVEDRNRFRFRLFADYKLNDQFFAGVAVQTAIGADSGNTTVSEGFDNYGLYLWRFFVGWKSKDENLKIIAGKQPNPFYEETELLWDADISPYGLTEQYKVKISPQFEIGAIAGQFYYYDNNENAYDNGTANGTGKVIGGNNNSDAYLFYQQIVTTFKPSNNLSLTGAVGYFFYGETGGDNSAGATLPAAATAATTGPGQGAVGNLASAGNSTGQNANALTNTAAFAAANAERDLGIGTFNGDVKIGLGAFKLKVYGQAAYNFFGGARDRHEYAPLAAGVAGTALPTTAIAQNYVAHLDSTTDKLAFATGLTFGTDYTIKKKGDWLLLAEFRQVGLGSIDPNLNDSDFNQSRLGFRGVKVAGSYAFNDFIIASVTGYLDENLGSEKNLNLGVGNYNTSHIVQFDLTFKF